MLYGYSTHGLTRGLCKHDPLPSVLLFSRTWISMLYANLCVFCPQTDLPKASSISLQSGCRAIKTKQVLIVKGKWKNLMDSFRREIRKMWTKQGFRCCPKAWNTAWIIAWNKAWSRPTKKKGGAQLQ
ncbi:hypothetical protein FKM82_001486 [Ascaphus truei]